MQFTYDYCLDELSARWVEADPLYTDNHLAILTPNIVYYWASQIIQPAIYNVPNRTITLPSYQLDIRVFTNRNSSDPWFERHDDRIYPNFGDVKPFGNQEVFGLVGKGGFELWFFNPNFVPDVPNTEPLATDRWDQVKVVLGSNES